MNEQIPFASDTEAAVRALPNNIEAEQAVLGALLVNNEVYDRLAAFLLPEHFYDPVHGQIYEIAGEAGFRGR